jgi:hypothetical protein
VTNHDARPHQQATGLRRIHEHVEREFEAWGHWVHRRRRLVITVMSLLPLMLASQMSQIVLDVSNEAFLHEQDPVRIQYDEFRRQFGMESMILIAIRPPEVFAPGFLSKLRALHEAMEDEVPNVDEVMSLINARVTRGEDDELIVEELFEDWPETPEALARVEQLASTNPLYRNLLLSEDGSMTVLSVRLSAFSALAGDDDFTAGFEGDTADVDGSAASVPFMTPVELTQAVKATEAVLAEHVEDDWEVYFTGDPPVSVRIAEDMQQNIGLFLVLGLLTIAVVLYVLFRRLSGVLLPLLVVFLSILSTFGAVGMSGLPLGVPSQILPSFLLAVGVGSALHIMVIFYQEFDRGATPEDAVAFALGHSGLAVSMASVTTAGGLASFTAAELAPVSVLGFFAPFGVLIGLVFCLTLLPALLVSLPLRRRAVGADTSEASAYERGLARVGDFSVDHAGPVAIVWLALVVVSLIGASRLSFSHDTLRWFPEDDPIRTHIEAVDAEMGGTMMLEVVVDTGRENGLHEPAALDALSRFHERVASLTGAGGLHVGKATSLLDVVEEIHAALNADELGPGERPAALPETREAIAQELLLFESAGSDDLEKVVDSQFSSARITLKLPYVAPMNYGEFIPDVEASLDEFFGGNVEVYTTGFMALLAAAFKSLGTSLLRSYALALVIIAPLMVLLIGNLRGGAVSMLPNLAPIIMTLGLMGWTGIYLDAFTLLIGSIAIGLAVDDTIHFMHNFERYYERSGDVRDAVAKTLRTTGQALLMTSIVLSAGFFIYMSAALENFFFFGLLTGFTILVAFLADVVLAPALVALAARRPRAVSES